MTEERAAKIDDNYASQVSAPENALLQLTDSIISMPHRLTEDQRTALQAHFSTPQIAEAALGVSLFLAMSKVLIMLGLEPEQMDTTVIPTPGS